MNPLLHALLILTVLIAPAGARPPYEYHFSHSAGQAFAFIGDEATSDGYFSQYVENFYYTRYFDRKLIFYNAGTRNDTAADVLERLEADIVERRLDYAIVMLGTWDGEFRDLSPPRFEIYRRNLTELLDRLERARIHPFLMSPPMFDLQSRESRLDDETYRFRLKPVAETYNGVLGYFTAWLQEESQRRGVRFIDAWGALNRATHEQRKTNPLFSLLPDSITPDPGGGAVVAGEIIAALAPEREDLGSIVLVREDEKSGWKSRSQGGTLAQLEGSGDQLSFLWRARSLPWAMPDEAMIGADIAGIDARFNRETLQVLGLTVGTYELRIAGELMPRRYSHLEFASGVALHEIRERPQYQRALHIATMNAERYRETVSPLREHWQTVKRARVNYPQDDARIAAVLTDLTPKMNALRIAARERADKIYEAAAPLSRSFEIRRYWTEAELKIRAAAEEKALREAEAAQKAAASSSTPDS